MKACEVCSTTIDTQYGSGRFCSKRCKDKFCAAIGWAGQAKVVAIARKTARDVYVTRPKTCKYCNKDLPYEKRYNSYCNRRCAAFHTNEKFHDRKRGPSPGVVICAKCTGIYSKVVDGIRTYSKYCITCRRDPRKITREKLLRIRGHKCEDIDCGITTWKNKPVPLQVDHLDGDSDNWNPANVRLLCGNCHLLTPTWGARNKGRFPNAKRNKVRLKYRQKLRVQGA